MIAQVLITIAFNSRASAQLHLFIDLVCNVGTYVGTNVGTYIGTNVDTYIGTNVGIYSVAAKYGIIMKLPTYLPAVVMVHSGRPLPAESSVSNSKKLNI